MKISSIGLLVGLVALGENAHARQSEVPLSGPIPAVSGTPQVVFALRSIEVKVGTGAAMAPRKCAYAHYTGWLTDGRKFDSSRDTTPAGKPKSPISFPQGARRVIAGWDIGFEGMRVGGQRRLFIPYQLAYGEAGRPPLIPAKSELIFDVELVAVADTLPRAEPTPRGQTAPPPQCPAWTALSADAPMQSTAAAPTASSTGIVHVTVQTEFGNIELAIDSAHAPVSATNFLRYVDANRYSGGRFHRTVTLANQETSPVKIEVIQASAARIATGAAAGAARGGSGGGFPPIPLERTNQTGLKHLDGTVSVARAGPDTGTSDFFICIGNQPELDFGGKRNADGQGFAAFGQVTSGMDIVRRIQASPAKGQSLEPAIAITNIVRKR